MQIPVRLPPPGAGRVDVAGLGENSLDLVATLDAFPRPDSKMPMEGFARLPGGQVATAMAATARLGWVSRYVGRVGDDEGGRLVCDSLVSEGVDTSAVAILPGVTTRLSMLLVDRSAATRTVLWHRDPALRWPGPRALTPGPGLPVEALLAARVLLLDGTDVDASRAAARAARAAGVPVVADVDTVGEGVDALLADVDVIMAAASFAEAVTGRANRGDAVARLASRYPQAAVVCVTYGEDGSLARCEGRELFTPAFPVRCVDSTGAGDVFRAGFLAGWLRGGEGAGLAQAMRYASAAAALNCRGLGARGALPTRAEVDDLLHST